MGICPPFPFFATEVGRSVFLFSGEISLFFNKEIRNFLEFFFLV
jgi:hypothetical protein